MDLTRSSSSFPSFSGEDDQQSAGVTNGSVVARQYRSFHSVRKLASNIMMSSSLTMESKQATTSPSMTDEIDLSLNDDDHRTTSLPPIGSSGLAFTIDFDDCNNNINNVNKGPNINTTRKRLDIRDSIRKFAPPKPQTIERPRPPAKNSNNSTIITREQTDKQSSGQSSPLARVSGSIGGGSATISRSQTTTIQSNPIRKVAMQPPITDLSDGACFLIQRMLAENMQRQQTPPSSVVTSRIASPPSKCSSSSVHLRPNGSSSKSSKSSFRSRGELDSGVCDDHRSDGHEEDLEEEEDTRAVVEDDEEDRRSDKGRDVDELSETGTYTVELDKCDPVEEEARKRIAEIFGSNGVATNVVNGDHCSASSTSSDSRKNSFQMDSVDSLQRILLRPDNNSVVSNKSRRSFDVGPSGRKGSSLNNSIGGSPLPERRSLQSGHQTPLASTERLNELTQRFRAGTRLPNAIGRNTVLAKSTTSSSNVSKNNNTFVTRNTGSSSPRARRSNDSNSALTSSSAAYQRSASVTSQRSTVSTRLGIANQSANQASTRSSGTSTINSLRNSGRNTTRGGLPEREDSLSLRSEEASSGGSTDLSSIGSERCKSDLGASSMRYNRTFALRRAHLGLPIEGSQQSSFIPNKNSGRKTPISSTANNSTRQQQFDRGDGGRFSLRLAKTNSKPSSFSVAPVQSNVLSNSRRPPTHPPTSASVSGRITPVEQSNTVLQRTTPNLPSSISSNYQHVRARSFGGIEQRNELSPVLIGSGSKTLDESSLPTVQQSSHLPTPGTLSNIPTDSQVRSLQMLSPFQLSRRLFSTKSHYMATSGSLRSRNDETSTLISEPTFGCSNNSFVAGNNINNHSFSLTASCNSPSMTASFTETRSTSGACGPISSLQTDSVRSKCLSSLDYLVLSAVHQLSFKLRCKLRTVLENEKSKYPLDNENRILIEELLPQVNVSEFRGSESSEKTISRDLSNVLKNLKRIEQSLEVITLLLECNHDSSTSLASEVHGNPSTNSNYFSVDI